MDRPGLYDRCLVVLLIIYQLTRNDLENSNETWCYREYSRDTLARWSSEYLSECCEARSLQFGSPGAKVRTTS